jgi:chromosome segregation ATPase
MAEHDSKQIDVIAIEFQYIKKKLDKIECLLEKKEENDARVNQRIYQLEQACDATKEIIGKMDKRIKDNEEITRQAKPVLKVISAAMFTFFVGLILLVIREFAGLVK